ncbi:MAG TPA: rhodanese-like domain-containing protein [Thermodesulfobacteriota bacterium]|nr:hypothetical protein [Deltaproteobacteria bacterium]HNR12639.1 rhodanese-like domain-containing protein [Thermodesulfobacteriota bacterium]HNU71160.1 rhodanese-like domain-containing protein [Thermodesulfobacteriota bacterium]HQO77105.1 rhodanese-like domain-containing protein [Thermodesulfobacteriota bacterium]
MRRALHRAFEVEGVAVILIFVAIACAQEVPRINNEEALQMMGRPDVVVIDVRMGPEWQKSDAKIRGAVRENPDDVDSWMHTYGKDKTLIFYCS